MELLFSIIGILLLLAILAGAVFLLIFLAKKIGIIKTLHFNDSVSANTLTTEAKSEHNYMTNIKHFSQSLIFRFILIVLLVGVMNIPLSMVESVVYERSNLYRSVLSDISETWGERQAVQGPALLIPYTEKRTTVKTHTDKYGNEQKVNQVNYYSRTAIVLPDDLNIDAALLNETRKRSLYEAQVYNASVNITGAFTRPDISKLSNYIEEIHWDRAWLTLGITDTQAINKVSQLNWGSSHPQAIDFEPGTKIIETIRSGFHAPIDLSQSSNGKSYPFSLKLNINGSGGFYFSPFGKVTNVAIKSDWPHPSFQGNVLPDQHDITDHGFTANWSVPNLARNYPQLWTLSSEDFNVNEFSAGVNIFESVSLYSKITRAIKYGSLFFILTYITFLIFELGIKKRLHLVQYGMIGLALSMFYLTLLSVAEHLGFFTAYVSAASVIIVMISLYAYSAIRSISRTSIISLLLAGLYCMLYSMLKLEESALISGTILLLFILAVMMYMTRNIGKEA